MTVASDLAREVAEILEPKLDELRRQAEAGVLARIRLEVIDRMMKQGKLLDQELAKEAARVAHIVAKAEVIEGNYSNLSLRLFPPPHDPEEGVDDDVDPIPF